MDDDLLEAVKGAALSSGITLTRFIEDAVRRQLTIQQDIEYSAPTPLPLFAGDGLHPGVDLDSNADLLHIMSSEQ
jgi:hypothetical protein